VSSRKRTAAMEHGTSEHIDFYDFAVISAFGFAFSAFPCVG
jgi:hypothetical protein